MSKKLNRGLLGVVLLSLVDEVIILVVIILVLVKLRVEIPLWAIIIASSVFLLFTVVKYLALRKSPQLGFDNMVGLTGQTVEPVGRSGTIRINGELWFAQTNGEKIDVEREVTVVEQTGLKLTVVPKRNS